MLICFNGIFIWSCIAYDAKVGLCKYWTLGGCNFFFTYSKQCSLPYRKFNCILYNSRSNGFNNDNNFITCIEKFYHFKYEFYQWILDYQTFRFFLTLLSKLIFFWKVLLIDKQYSLAILSLFIKYYHYSYFGISFSVLLF